MTVLMAWGSLFTALATIIFALLAAVVALTPAPHPNYQRIQQAEMEIWGRVFTQIPGEAPVAPVLCLRCGAPRQPGSWCACVRDVVAELWPVAGITFTEAGAALTGLGNEVSLHPATGHTTLPSESCMSWARWQAEGPDSICPQCGRAEWEHPC